MSKKYRIIGKKLTHKEMKELRGQFLLAHRVITQIENKLIIKIEPCLITDIIIGENDRWEFKFNNQYAFTHNEPLFFNKKSLERYLKKEYDNGLELQIYE